MAGMPGVLVEVPARGEIAPQTDGTPWAAFTIPAAAPKPTLSTTSESLNLCVCALTNVKTKS